MISLCEMCNTCLMAHGSWLMAHGSWLMAHAFISIHVMNTVPFPTT